MSLLTDVKAFLVANGQSSNLFMGYLPDSPPSAAALYQYPGRQPEFVHNKSGIARDRPSLQVQVRDPVYATALARAEAIYALLATVVNATLGSTFYQRIEPLGSPFLLERDASKNTIIAQNHYITRQPS